MTVAVEADAIYTTAWPAAAPWADQIRDIINGERRRQGLAITALARRVGVDKTTMARWLDRPTFDQAERICAALGVRPDPLGVTRLPA